MITTFKLPLIQRLTLCPLHSTGMMHCIHYFLMLCSKESNDNMSVRILKRELYNREFESPLIKMSKYVYPNWKEFTIHQYFILSLATHPLLLFLVSLIHLLPRIFFSPLWIKVLFSCHPTKYPWASLSNSWWTSKCLPFDLD